MIHTYRYIRYLLHYICHTVVSLFQSRKLHTLSASSVDNMCVLCSVFTYVSYIYNITSVWNTQNVSIISTYFFLYICIIIICWKCWEDMSLVSLGVTHSMCDWLRVSHMWLTPCITCVTHTVCHLCEDWNFSVNVFTYLHYLLSRYLLWI